MLFALLFIIFAPLLVMPASASAATLTLTGITPSSGPVGTTITLYGCGNGSVNGFSLIYTGPISGSEIIPVVEIGGGCGYMSVTVPSNFLAGNYALKVRNNSTGEISVNDMPFTITGSGTVNTNNATSIGQQSATLNGTVNPNGASANVWFEYGPTSSFGNTTATQSMGSGNSQVSFSSSIPGLQTNTTYYFRAVAQNLYGTRYGNILQFTTNSTIPPPPPVQQQPTTTTNGATYIGKTYATLNGAVNPNGSFTNAWFEWGTTQSFGNSTSQITIGGGLSALAHSAYLSSLQPSTTYYYRIVANNIAGTTYGSIISFLTESNLPSGSQPTVNTNNAISVSQQSATLQGSVNPNSISTNAWFEYGTTLSFGNTTATQSMGGGNSQNSFSYSISNLQSNTTYYFRAVAQNSSGISYGSILSFSTIWQGQGNSVPVVTTHSVNVPGGQTYATLNGSVNPNNSFTNAWFEWGTTTSFGNTAPQQSVSGGTSVIGFSYTISALSQNMNYYYRAVASNSFGVSYGNILSFSTSFQGGSFGIPTATTMSATNINPSSATLNGFVSSNNTYTTAWFEYGTSSSLGYTTGFQSVGNNYSSNYNYTVQNLSPNTTYYYRAGAQNSSGTSYGTILTFSTGSQGSYVGSAPILATLIPTVIYQNVALIRGEVNPNGSFTNSWFEWGTTQTLGNRTPSQSVGFSNATSQYLFVLSGLSANTDYYYRAVGQNANSIAYGNIIQFKTLSSFSSVPTATAVQTPRVITTNISAPNAVAPEESEIILTPTADKSNISAGDDIVYVITYNNNTNTVLRNAVLKIVLPPKIEFSSSNIIPTKQEANTITYVLGTINPKSQSAIGIRVRAQSSIDNNATLIFGATLEYTASNDAFRSQSAYLTITTKENLAGTASILDTLGPFANVMVFLGFLFIIVAFYFAYQRLFKQYILKKRIIKAL